MKWDDLKNNPMFWMVMVVGVGFVAWYMWY